MPISYSTYLFAVECFVPKRIETDTVVIIIERLQRGKPASKAVYVDYILWSYILGSNDTGVVLSKHRPLHSILSIIQPTPSPPPYLPSLSMPLLPPFRQLELVLLPSLLYLLGSLMLVER